MKTAVVTGSSSGIGRATAIQLASSGYDLVLHAHRSLDELQETARLVRRVNAQCKVLCITADIRSPSRCSQLVQACFSGPDANVHAWVNNAGADILTTDLRTARFEEKLQALLDVDLLGTMRLSRLVGEHMQLHAAADAKRDCQNAPSIINVGWDQAWLGMEGDAGQLFGTTKAAVMAFTKSLAMTLAPEVRVNGVAPGWIQTEWGESASEYWNNRALNETLLGRWGTAEDVARAVSWLVSSDSAYINGDFTPVNGGRNYGGYANPTK